MAYIERLENLVQGNVKTIVLPESDDERVLEAAKVIEEKGLVKIILLGENYLNPSTYSDIDLMASKLVEIRSGKLTLPEAKELLQTNYMYFAIMLVVLGKADGVVSGARHSSSDTLRPALQILKKESIASSFFIMETNDHDLGEDGILLFADCGMIQDPTSEELVTIAHDSAESFKTLVGATPKVAMLSHSTLGSAKGPLVDKVIKATTLFKEKYPDVLVEGELQVDAALNEDVAKRKGDNISGKSNVLIFPNIDAGNMAYKLVQILGHAKAYGPLTQGLSHPVNDLSRGCSVDDIITVILITAYQAF
ncbi:MAG: phosphotransacetylase [Bacilli bacterium]|nr:phosphotransacetylase [Bacilli bacterium]